MSATISGQEPAAASAAPSLLVRLRGLRPTLSPAEDRVAEQVLLDPRGAAGLTISQLAASALTSETTVLRFCKRLGLPGYPQLRLALAEAAMGSRSTSAPATEISAGDSIDDIIAKVAFADAGAVEDTAHTLDRGALAAAASAVAGARRVDIYGVASSALVGRDLQHKLQCIGSLAFCWGDPHVALMSARQLVAGDVAIGVSQSGTTTETVEALRSARVRGATTVAITNFPRSPLAVGADFVLTTAARDSSLRSGATASRIAALCVVDCLYVAVALMDPERARAAVEQAVAAVATHHLRH